MEGDRTPVDAQEDQPQPPAGRRPAGHLGIEARGLWCGDDRRPGHLLPAQALDCQRLIEMSGVLFDVQRDLAQLLQPTPAAPQVTAHIAAQAPLVSLPVTVHGHEG